MEDRDLPSVGDHDVKIRVRAGGICGSDLHYLIQGRNGDFVIREPLVPGHEFAGEVTEIGAAVTAFQPGDRVTVHPGRSCGHCRPCREGRPNLCQQMFQMGSASRLPHMHGAFCEFVAVDESQCHKVSDDLDFTIAAFAEPLSVALYAAQRAGNLMGQRVLITGAGPIGQLMALAAKRGGAVNVTMTDIQDPCLARAAKIGADQTINTATEAGALEQMAKDIGGFDVAFEVSGATSALNDAIGAVHPGATIVQVGTLPPGPQPILGNRIMGKELDVRGMHRFGNVFPDAVACLDRRQIDVSPILTAVVPMAKAVEAFKMAGDRAHHLKVVIAF
ncbi:L-idonate 5-dehydrogenase [Telmatospirillum sp.]|uniref:L-idonate 5-dehydrogenase n=1 Tax=Telmatospirillum sp. TaxID=2079197 RepID=UPI00283FCEEE|nr:L-idonate 5-dehydrogenase [Telmatospirillum sp.]MDR3438798.1 L-idonate 5-dehydrogenase [Telmatospirillum sp.]